MQSGIKYFVRVTKNRSVHGRSESRELLCVSVVGFGATFENFVDLSLQLILEGEKLACTLIDWILGTH